jgi:Fur family ferric uptake transcriptional regulator
MLRTNNSSVTESRILVFKVLQGSEPITMNELVSKCAQRMDRASVYRTIALFETLGIVQRLQIGWKYKLELSNRFSVHHHHLTCVQCNAHISLPEDPVIEQRLIELANQEQFIANDHRLEIKGLCVDCQKLELQSSET